MNAAKETINYYCDDIIKDGYADKYKSILKKI